MIRPCKSPPRNIQALNLSQLIKPMNQHSRGINYPTGWPRCGNVPRKKKMPLAVWRVAPWPWMRLAVRKVLLAWKGNSTPGSTASARKTSRKAVSGHVSFQANPKNLTRCRNGFSASVPCSPTPKKKPRTN